MPPTRRRLLYAVLYETVAVALVAPVLSLLFGAPPSSALALTLAMSAVALAWNLVFNAAFEAWEARQPDGGRTWRRRAAHGIGFEGGLVLMLVPMMAWWLDITLWQAFIADLGLLLFFLGYTVAFTWAFDRVVGLPDSALRPAGAAPRPGPEQPIRRTP